MIEDHANLQSTLEQHLQNSVQVPCLLICDDLLAATNPASLDYLGKPSKKKDKLLQISSDHPNKVYNLQIISNIFFEGCFQAEIFAVYSRHSRISVIFVSQKFYPSLDNVRLIHGNCDYIVAFANNHDVLQFLTFARRAFPHNYKTLVQIFETITEDENTSFGYLQIDLRAVRKKQTMLLTQLFENPHMVKAFLMTK